MSSHFEMFKKQIDDALTLIDGSNVVGQDSSAQRFPLAQAVDTLSLLDRCEQVSTRYKPTKPTIRIIHHLACSGGTLISKCISAMPNVYLLSEVHPYSDLAISKGKPKYSPTDIIALSKYAGIPKQKELAGDIFKRSVVAAYDHVTSLGGTLVLRDHTHADFHTEVPISPESSVVTLLKTTYNIKSILTLRNPVDSYISLVENKWVHFRPQTFDEYCQRILVLARRFDMDHIFKYEDFVEDPVREAKKIVEKIDVKFDASFENIYSLFRVTGDSGRSAEVIAPRTRKNMSENIKSEVRESRAFRTLLEELDFKDYFLEL